MTCAGKSVFLSFKTYRSSHRRCSLRKDVLRNFAKFTGKHLLRNFAKFTGKHLLRNFAQNSQENTFLEISQSSQENTLEISQNSQENTFSEISQNSQEKTCARVSFLIMLPASTNQPKIFSNFLSIIKKIFGHFYT